MRRATSLAFAGCFEREFVQFNPGERDLHGMTVFLLNEIQTYRGFGACTICSPSRVHAFISMTHKKVKYPCALISTIGENKRD